MYKRFIVVAVTLLVALMGVTSAGICKRGACKPKVAPRVTVTNTSVFKTEVPAPNQPQSGCDFSYPNPQIPGTCAYATRQAQLATWEAANCGGGEWVNGVLNCQATALPPLPTVAPTLPGYPPPYP